MAQTRRKRQTKHRGNAAGFVESRGRTGRKPTTEEKKTGLKKPASADGKGREERAPTWRGSFVRAMFAAVLFLVILLVTKIGKSNEAVAFFPIVLLIYWPISYYSERWVYNRRQRSKQRAGAKAGQG